MISDQGFAAAARFGVLIHPVIVSFDRRVLLSLLDVITLSSMSEFSLFQCNVSVERFLLDKLTILFLLSVAIVSVPCRWRSGRMVMMLASRSASEVISSWYVDLVSYVFFHRCSSGLCSMGCGSCL